MGPKPPRVGFWVTKLRSMGGNVHPSQQRLGPGIHPCVSKLAGRRWQGGVGPGDMAGGHAGGLGRAKQATFEAGILDDRITAPSFFGTLIVVGDTLYRSQGSQIICR